MEKNESINKSKNNFFFKSTYPKVALFEQLGSNFHFQDHEVNKFWSHVFKAYKVFGKSIHVENSAEPIFCNQNILVGNGIKEKEKRKKGLTNRVTLKVC